MMFNLLIICAIILIIALAIAIISVWAIWLDHRHKKSLEELSKYQMHLGMPINDIPTILSMVIDECFTDYKIKFLSLRILSLSSTGNILKLISSKSILLSTIISSLALKNVSIV